MSILIELEGYVDKTCEMLGLNLSDVRMLELGNQRMGVKGRADFKKAYKDVLIERGIKEHVSFDINGQNGALVKDLSKYIAGWDNYFDIVTNFGTAEHVSDQYWAFKNIHDKCKNGGAMLHFGPPVDDWPGHCDYRYTNDFFKTLGDRNGYTVKLTERIIVTNPNPKKNRWLLTAILIKINGEFMSEKDFYEMGKISGHSSYKG